MAIVAIAFAAVLLGATPAPAWHTYRAHDLAVHHPPSWHATGRRLTPVDYPRQVLALASYTLPRGASGADGCRPTAALDRMPPNGAFVFAWEYARPSPLGPIRARDFPPRPTHFRPTGFARYECLGPSYMLRFRQSGRFFQVHVAFGRRASTAMRATVLRILDSIEVV